MMMKVTLPSMSWILLGIFLFLDLVASETTTSFSDCDRRGFHGSRLNKCGFCVEGSSGLAVDFGVDCAGTCNGTAFVDCAGTCDGDAYVDECSGVCLGAATDDGRFPPQRQKSPPPQAYRDCRGLCDRGDSSDVVYQTDDCGVCTVTMKNDSGNALLSKKSANGTSASRYKDCADTCYTPATAWSMAKVDDKTCNQCVGPNTTLKLESIVDQCGHCLPTNDSCPCPKTEQDLCGVCQGSNDSCTTISSASPTVIPSDTPVVVTVTGVTLKSKYHSKCLLIRQDIQKDGRDEETFPANVHGTTITCSVSAPQGIYKLYLGVSLENGELLSRSNTSLPFIVYPKKGSVDSMSPSSLPVGKHNSSVVTFATQHLDNIKTIYCIVYGEDSDKATMVASDNVTSDQASCPIPSPEHSTVISVNVSLDRVSAVAGPFRVKFYAPAPVIKTFVPLPEGDSVLVFFDVDVAIDRLTNCSKIFTQETIKAIGNNASCVWVTTQQLLVTVGRSGGNALGNTNNNGAVILKFKDVEIYPDNEKFAEAAQNLTVAFALADEKPLAVLVGPNQVAPCGDFVLDGHQSTGIQYRRVRFTWDVTAAKVNGDLKRLLADATANNTRSLVVPSDMLECEVTHTFRLTVSNGPLSDDTARSTATLEVTRSKTEVPSVFIEPSFVHYRDAVDVDARFTLHTNLDIPMCLRELYSINFRWSTPEPKVKFDVAQMEATSYVIEPYTLPPGENVTFQVEVWLNNNQNVTGSAQITFQVAPSGVRAHLSGGLERSVGNESGILVLNASDSRHVVSPRVPLVYRWECLEEDKNPCYNYDASVEGQLLLPHPVTRQSTLAVATRQLRPRSRLTVNVRAYSPLNETQVSETQSAVIHVTTGDAPTVTIESIEPSTTVASDRNVRIVANVVSSSPLESVQWIIPGFTRDLKPYSMSESLDERRKRVTVVIPKDFVVANGLYDINVTVSDNGARTGWALGHFTVVPPVTDCRVTVPEYEAFKMTYVYVDSCKTGHRNRPLRYQVFIGYKGHPMSLMGPTYHLPIAIMGPPLLPSNDADNYNTFLVQVCNAQNSCWWFNHTGVEVTPTGDLQEAADHAFAMANIGKLTSNYLACLRRHAFLLMAVTPTFQKQHEIEIESQIAQAFLCARKAGEIQCETPACFADLFSYLTAIPIDSKTSREFMMTEVMERTLERLERQNSTLNAIGVQEVLLVLEAVYRFNASDRDMAKKVVHLEDRFQRILARSLQVGESPLLVDAEGNPVMLMRNSHLRSLLKVVTNSTTNSSVSVDFGEGIRSRYNSWTCKPDGSLCPNIITEVHFFPDHLYRLMDVDINNTVSTVVKVALLHPLTGEDMPIPSKVSNAIDIRVSVDRSRMTNTLAYNCYDWDGQKWTWDGIETLDNGGEDMRCVSDHVGTFAVIGREPKLSPWIIVAIVVGALVVLALFVAGGFYFYRKSRSKSMRVSVSKGYQPDAQ